MKSKEWSSSIYKSSLLDFDCTESDEGDGYEPTYGFRGAPPASPPAHYSFSGSLSHVSQPYLKTKFICLSSPDRIEALTLDESFFDMHPSPNIEASPLKLPPYPGRFGAPMRTSPGMFGGPMRTSPGIFGAQMRTSPGIFGAPMRASHHKLLQDPPPSYRSMESLSMTHSRPPPGPTMSSLFSMTGSLPPATSLDTSVPSFVDSFCGSPRRMSKPMSYCRAPRPPPPASAKKSVSFSMSDRGLLAPLFLLLFPLVNL